MAARSSHTLHTYRAFANWVFTGIRRTDSCVFVYLMFTFMLGIRRALRWISTEKKLFDVSNNNNKKHYESVKHAENVPMFALSADKWPM